MDAPLTPDRLSALIGAIYDCAVEPNLWPTTIGQICADIDCMMGALILVDLQGSRHRFISKWDTPAGSENYFDEMTLLYRSAPNALTQSIDEPLVLSRDIPEEIWTNTRYYREWAKPLGIRTSHQ
jgi:hypothetical protein